MKLVAPSEYRAMPWKNGGGTTWEVALHPRGADLNGFGWRVSIAEVASDGPFSTFPGIDRTLVVLAGDGMRLTGVGDAPVDLRPFDAIAFPGEARVESALLDGPTRDFNVMVRRGAWRADVRVMRDSAAAMPAATTYVVHAASGASICAVDAARVEVPEGHTLVTAGSQFAVDATRGAAAVVVMVTA
ncbi:MAG: HutD family protein [Burkholderiales bacterium]